jgi:hypothetical protein
VWAWAFHSAWVAIDLNLEYVKAGAFRFLKDRDSAAVAEALPRMESGETEHIWPLQPQLI